MTIEAKPNGLAARLANPWLSLVCRLVVGVVFIYASLDKVAHPAAFAEIVNNYQILPHSLINITAILLPWIELVAGLLLVLGVWSRGNSLIFSVMLIVFIAAIGYNISRGLDFNCGCFDVSEDGMRIGWTKIWQNIVLLALSLHVLFRESALDLGRLLGPRWR
jgi:uncharacterized membrane protein YphA (DoxX/SURF4 family)